MKRNLALIVKYLIHLLLFLASVSIYGQMNKSKKIKINNYALNYNITGTGNETLLFLHGFALSTESWGGIVSKIDTNKYKIICIDILGFGFSEKPTSFDYSIESQSSLIESFLKELNIDTISLIGHSYGGVIGLYLTYKAITAQNDIKIKKEVLIDVPAFSDIRPKFIDILESDFLSFLALKIMPARALAKYMIKTTFYNYKDAKNNHLERYTFFLKQKNIDESMVQMAKNILPDKTDDIVSCYSHIDFPVLIIWGQNDALIPVENGVSLAAKIKTSEMKIIPNCGHVPQEECPVETAYEINKFLDTK